MSSRYQKGSLQKTKRKTGAVVWTFRWREDVGGSRVRRKKVIGTIEEFPTRKAAEQAVAQLRSNINTEVGSPQTVNDLIAHFRVHELTPERRAFASIETFNIMASRYVEPTWGACRLSDVRTVKVEEWLKTLPLSPASKTKIKSTMSVLYNHAIRHEWLTFNPLAKVRTSQKRLREKDVLDPTEFQALLEELSVRDRAMVLLAASSGLRRSELVALTWADLDTDLMEISITRAYVRSRFGDTKTDASKKPVPLHPVVLGALTTWRGISPFAGRHDFLFASLRKNGEKPLSPDSLLAKSIKPAVKRAGITKQIGWHSFRHSLATWLRQIGVDVKVAQELMRHTKSATTMDIYTHGVSSLKRAANDNLVEFMLPTREKEAS
jgi:integrase